MTYYPPVRLVSDDEIRASYNRERAMRHACAQLLHYIQGEMEPKLERLLQSVRDTSASTMNHLAVAIGFEAAKAATHDPAELQTLQLAAEHLDYVMDVYEAGAGNFSQRHIAHSLTQDRARAVTILQAVLNSPDVEKFWQTHQTGADGRLDIKCHEALGEHVRRHYERVFSAEDQLMVHLNPGGMPR